MTDWLTSAAFLALGFLATGLVSVGLFGLVATLRGEETPRMGIYAGALFVFGSLMGSASAWHFFGGVVA